jgi:DNA repair exonuclease SbcCD ATPase subunit
MPNTVAELDKELDEFKKQMSGEIAHLKTLLEGLQISDEIESKADIEAVERLENEVKALQQSFHDKIEKLAEKLEKALKERLEEKANAIKEKIDDNNRNMKERLESETKAVKEKVDDNYDKLDDKIRELKSDINTRRTWSISITSIIVAIVGIILHAAMNDTFSKVWN